MGGVIRVRTMQKTHAKICPTCRDWKANENITAVSTDPGVVLPRHITPATLKRAPAPAGWRHFQGADEKGDCGWPL